MIKRIAVNNILRSLVCLSLFLAPSGCTSENSPPVTEESPPKAKGVAAIETSSPPSALAEIVKTKAAIGAKVLLVDPLPLQRVELPAEALAIWRDHAAQRPALLLLSGNPMLVQVPSVLRNEVQSLIEMGSRAEIARRSSMQVADPLLMPVMTVDAALRAGWFSQVFWALPLRDSKQELSAEAFRKQLRDNGLLSEDELARLNVEKHQLRGTVRGTPFTAAPLEFLPAVTGAVVVHIDQSYFQDLYKNEMATPLLPIVYDTLSALRERRTPVVAATFAYGNLEERIALDVRFVGEMLAHFIEHPERAKEPAPPNWARQGDIYQLENLFEYDKIRDLALAMEREEPESAWVKFSLYRAAAAKKSGEVALGYLAEAVKRDGVYALEYLSLAYMAYEKRRPDASLQMMKLAADAFPENPLIRLKIAQLSSELGERKSAEHLVEQLQQLPWSTVYYPDMPAYLQGFVKFLKEKPPSGASDPRVSPN